MAKIRIMLYASRDHHIHHDRPAKRKVFFSFWELEHESTVAYPIRSDSNAMHNILEALVALWSKEDYDDFS